MPRRLKLLPRLLAMLGLLTLGVLAIPSAGQAAVWGELGHFGEKGGELVSPEAAFGVNPEDGSAWTVDTVISSKTGESEFRLQKFEQVSGTWKAVASDEFRSAESEGEIEVEGIAFDATLHRAYLLIDQERPKDPNKGEQAVSELYAFSTTTAGGKIDAAAETTNGVLVGQTEEVLKGSPVGQTKFAPSDKEKGLSLIEPGGIAVNPTNHQIVITGWIGNEVPVAWAISSKGKIEADWEDEKGFFENCGCLSSPVVTSTGKILAFGSEENVVYELPSNLSSATAPTVAVWLPTSRFECERLEEEAKAGKKVETCPFVEGLTKLDPGNKNLGGEMTTGPEGNLYVHIKIPNFAEGENVFGGVMVLNSKLEELGWTGGGSSAAASQACSVNETGVDNGGAALIGAANENVFMFERGAPLAEQSKVLELGPGGSTPGCPKGSATPPTTTANGIPLESFPLSDKIAFSSKVTQANALSTEWEFEPGVKETVNKRQQQTTLAEHKFAKEGKFTVIERIHSDDLATPVIEVSKAVTIIGPPKVREEKVTVEGTSATLKAEVNPNQQLTECEFQYGKASEAFTAAGIKKVKCPEPLEGEEFVSESTKVSGLEAGQEYHFRLVAKTSEFATSQEGTKWLAPEEGGPEAETLAASGVGSTTATLNGKVNPKGSATSCKFEYGTTGAYGKTAPCSTAPGAGSSPVAVSAEVSGLTGSSTYHFRLTAENAGGKKGVGLDKELKTTEAGAKPTVETLPAGAVTQTGATLKANVNPHGETTECHFQYGTTTAYGKEAPCFLAPGNGRANVEESALLSGLTPATAYHFRLIAKNPLGEERGADVEFTTVAKLAPTAETLGASGVSSSSATLTGKVNPKGEATNCRFLYGPTSAYGKEVPCATAPGSGSEAVSVSAAVSGLAASTVYHYKLIAESTAGKGEGADAELLSAAPQVVVTNPPVTTTTQPPAEKGVQPFTEASPDVTIAGTALTVTGTGGFSLKLSCPAGATQCAGTVTVKTITAVAASSARTAKAKKAILTLASGSFTIAGGKLKVLSLHLSAKARALLSKLHTVRARLTVVAHNPQGTSHTMISVLTLKAAKKKKH
jgi:hypothetical protein